MFAGKPNPLTTLEGDDGSLIRVTVEAGCRHLDPGAADDLGDLIAHALAAVKGLVLAGRRVTAVVPSGVDDDPPASARYPIDGPALGVTARATLFHSPA